MRYDKGNPLKVVTLCSGIDFQCQALDRLVQKCPPFSYDLLAWSEIDKYAITIHDLLYPQWKDRNLGDMTMIDWSKFDGEVDCLTYSTPCTDLSLAGRQEGMTEGSGTRSSILWFTRNAIIAKHPKFLVLENVKNMVGKKFKPYFDKWLAELEGYGYKNFWKVINAADCGVPQSRERVFCVSILRTDDDPDPQFYFPKPIPLTECMADRLDPKGTVREKYWLSEQAVQYYERVDADKTHNHNFTRKKKRT